MVSSTSRLSYSDCLDAFNKALEDPVGVRIKFTYSGDANHFRLRLHAARRQDREGNREVYEIGDPMFGRSIYDGLVVRIREVDDEIYVYIEHLNMKEAEPLSEVEEPEVAPSGLARRI